MSLLDSLLHLRRRQCEERRGFIAELEHLAERLRADSGRLQAEIERAVAAGNPASARKLIERHGKIERSVAAIEGQIATAGDALAAVEQGLQRRELAAAQRAGNAGLADRQHARRSRRARTTASPSRRPDR